MNKAPGIHQRKGTFRRHYLAEWLAERRMKPMDLINALNEPEDEPYTDKSQVYKWLKGQLPHRGTQIRIAAVLSLIDPETDEPLPELLMRHPAEDWIARRLRGRSPEEIDRVRKAIELVLPDRTGTEG